MIAVASGSSSFKRAALDLVQDADREERVLVDRVDVVHVVLHLRDDAAEIGNEAAEHAGLVHPAQRDFRILLRGQDFDEEAVGLGVVAQLASISFRDCVIEAQRMRMDVELVLLRDVEQPDERDRIVAERCSFATSSRRHRR